MIIKRSDIMRFVHMSDLHLGKRVGEFSMLEDQRYILGEILKKVSEHSPDCVFISGDIYDKPVPPAEAVTMFDELLFMLSGMVKDVFIISGNHDSDERIAFGSRLFDRSGVHISPVYDGTLARHTVSDEYGEVGVYLLPFIRPANIRHLFEDREINSYTDAVTAAIDAADIDYTKRNILLSHQFVTGGVTCDSEQLTVGGLENVDACAYDGFDYVALGHLHGAQRISDTMRYCGTPLKYSFSESRHIKSLTIGELKNKGELVIKTEPLIPMRDMREISGEFAQLTKGRSDDYLKVTLTDEVRVNDAYARLRNFYPNLIKIDYADRRDNETDITAHVRARENDPAKIFASFFKNINGRDMTDTQAKTVNELIERIWGENDETDKT